MKNEQGYTTISAAQAKRMMDSMAGYVILDVRTQEEYAGGHIRDAICIPNETVPAAAPAKLPDKDLVILVYCRSGRRSAEAAQKLAAAGYTNVYQFGGIIDWPYGIV